MLANPVTTLCVEDWCRGLVGDERAAHPERAIACGLNGLRMVYFGEVSRNEWRSRRCWALSIPGRDRDGIMHALRLLVKPQRAFVRAQRLAVRQLVMGCLPLERHQQNEDGHWSSSSDPDFQWYPAENDSRHLAIDWSFWVATTKWQGPEGEGVEKVGEHRTKFTHGPASRLWLVACDNGMPGDSHLSMYLTRAEKNPNWCQGCACVKEPSAGFFFFFLPTTGWTRLIWEPCVRWSISPSFLEKRSILSRRCHLFTVEGFTTVRKYVHESNGTYVEGKAWKFWVSSLSPEEETIFEAIEFTHIPPSTTQAHVQSVGTNLTQNRKLFTCWLYFARHCPIKYHKVI